jgi:transcriptional regulator of NAD metabolism
MVLLECENTLDGIFVIVIAIVVEHRCCGKLPKVLSVYERFSVRHQP